jgi:hypothetical protein
VVATSPATAPIVIDQLRDLTPASVVVDQAPATSTAPAVVETTAAPVAVSPIASTVPSAGDVSATVPTTAAPGGAIVVIGDGFAAPTTAPSVSVAVSTTVVTVTRFGGQLALAVVTATPSGPRLDLSGSGSLQVGEKSYSGSLTGRTALSGNPDSRGRQRLDASFVFSTADGPVEIRLAGYATAAPSNSPGDVSTASPTAFAISGVFKVASEKVPLLLSGTASGSLGSGLSLTLSN